MRTLALFVLCLFAGCKSGNREADTAPPTPEQLAMTAALDADARAGKERNHAPERGPLAQAVRDYVADMEGIDLSGCPADFAGAFRRHRKAWADMIPLLERYPNERGEMHDVFDRMTAEGEPDARELQALIDEVWGTWSAVEAALERHGMPPE